MKEKTTKISGDQHIKRLDALKKKREPLERYWKEAYQYTFPLRGEKFSAPLNGAEALAGSARSKQAEIFDITAIDCVRTLASALVSGSTPANSRWVEITVPDVESDEAKKWLESASDVIWQNIHASNYDVVAFEAMIDHVCSGMYCLMTEDGKDIGKAYNFIQWPLYSCYFADSKGSGRIDTVYREFTLTAEQALTEYGSKVSADVKKLASDKPDESIEFVLAIYPRKAKEISKFNLPYASCHIEKKTKQIVREKGYHEQPFSVPRWLNIPDSVYALGPISEAMPHIKSLNELVRLILANMDMATAGMWGALNDGVMNPRTVRVGARKIIPMASKDSLFPLTPGTEFDASYLQRDTLQKEIRKLLFSDQLQPQDGPDMTATEVHMRVGLIRQLLGPAYGRYQVDGLTPFVERCFGLAYRAGALGQPPEEISDKASQIRYTSPLARAQRMEDVNAMDRFEQGILMKAQIKPELLDVYDWEEAERKRGELLGVPQDLILSAEDTDEVRGQREQKQSQAMQGQAMNDLMQGVAPEVVKGAMNNPDAMMQGGGAMPPEMAAILAGEQQ